MEKRIRKGGKLTLNRKLGYPNLKTKIVSYTDETITVSWRTNLITIDRKQYENSTRQSS